jgi:hypothetical protein
MTTGGPKRLFRRRRLPGLVVYAGVLVLGVVAVTGVWLMFRSLGSGGETAPSPSPSASSPRAGKPKITGVVVQVLNGTSRKRLAANTTDELARAGYDVKDPANSKTPRKVTLIEYRPRFLADAAYLKSEYFPKATLRKVRSGLPGGVDIEVILGNDASG